MMTVRPVLLRYITTVVASVDSWCSSGLPVRTVSAELLHGTLAGVPGVKFIPRLSTLELAAISVTTSHCSPSPTKPPERTLPPPRACAAQRLFCSSSPLLLALNPKTPIMTPWSFLPAARKRGVRPNFRSPHHLSLVSAGQPFEDEYRRTSSLSPGLTSESSNPRSLPRLRRASPPP